MSTAVCRGQCYSLTESGAGYIDPNCPKHGERKCESCLGLVDEEGITKGDCPVFRSADGLCDECGACFCDGSC